MTNEFPTLRNNIKLVNNPQKKHLHIVEANVIKPKNTANKLPAILFITSYPPRECGIATYSQDLIKALGNKYSGSFEIQICALESEDEKHTYANEIKYTLNTDDKDDFAKLAGNIALDTDVTMVVIQHEFGFFRKNEDAFYQFLNALTKPVIIVLHTVLPNPDVALKLKVKQLSAIARSIIVMTHSSEKILMRDYHIAKEKMAVIAHGTHLVPYLDKEILKNKYSLTGRTVLSTFGLLSSGKNIETTLKALPAIVKSYPDVLFLIIGKTHPTVVKHDGEKYRTMLEEIVETLQLQQHVQFVNSFLPLPVLLEYLQLTDIYLFTSNNPNQAVSGTFSYAISCGCPVISTPIPHAKEVLKNDAGIIVDFESPKQLSDAVISLINDEELRKAISSKGLHRMAATAWENSAIAHATLLEKISDGKITLHNNLPEFNLDHIKKLTTSFGMIQFSKINQPDIDSGYTLDDNARAMVAMCQHFELTRDEADLQYIDIYLNFIKYCLQADGDFLNYVDEQQLFTEQNYTTNLEDSNGRAIWALGYLLSTGTLLPEHFITTAGLVMQKALLNVTNIHSTRAMAFIIKGVYYAGTADKSASHTPLIKELANRLVQMYKHEASPQWLWFESYLTYANSILPEAMLCAGLATGEAVYMEIAKASFDFLLSKIFTDKGIKVISNKGWLHKNNEFVEKAPGGEQPIDIAYTIMALGKFYTAFADELYRNKMNMAFDWFLGNNHLQQIIYNPCTGGCYDGLEENNVNLNQGAESTVSYLMARLTIEKLLHAEETRPGINNMHLFNSTINNLATVPVLLPNLLTATIKAS
jgi:glycosyltransferase involved in cell wall biosynthesis